MDSLDWDYEVTEVLFLRKFEEESKVWFRCWLEKVDEGKTLFFSLSCSKACNLSSTCKLGLLLGIFVWIMILFMYELHLSFIFLQTRILSAHYFGCCFLLPYWLDTCTNQLAWNAAQSGISSPKIICWYNRLSPGSENMSSSVGITIPHHWFFCIYSRNMEPCDTIAERRFHPSLIQRSL